MSSKRVVFVDDDMAVLNAYQRMLRHSDYQCDFFNEPNSFLQQCNFSDVSILLVDQQMPGLNGTEILSALNGQHPAMKRVLVSGNTVTAKSALRTGVRIDALLAKPCSKMALVNCINQLLDTNKLAGF